MTGQAGSIWRLRRCAILIFPARRPPCRPKPFRNLAQTKFAESDAYVRELMRETRAMPAAEPLAIERRTFFKLAGASGAGLVLGFHLPQPAFAATETPQTSAEASKDQSINAFVRIAPDNKVTVYSKAPEIGQGIKTAFGLIIAEELDADWNHVVVEQADFNPKVYGYQGAGGSTSIPRAWDQLRQAGAGAKAMLIAAAAKKWNVKPEEITAKESVLTHAPSGKTATYGQMANAAAKMPVPDVKSLALKTRAQYTLLGRRHHGVDDPKIVTGKPLFGIDVQLPGMLYCNFTKCPAVGGKVKSFNMDEIKARARRGRCLCGRRHRQAHRMHARRRHHRQEYLGRVPGQEQAESGMGRKRSLQGFHHAVFGARQGPCQELPRQARRRCGRCGQGLCRGRRQDRGGLLRISLRQPRHHGADEHHGALA